MPWWRRRREPDPAVAEEAEALGAALAGGPLGDRPVVTLPIEGGEVALAVEIEPHEVRDAWRAVRSVADAVGRWPVAVAGDGRRLDVDDLTNRWSYDGAPPARVLELARGVSVTEALAHVNPAAHWADENWTEYVDRQLEETVEAVGAAPPRDEALALRPDRSALDRLLLDFEEARRPTTESADSRHLEWFEPRGDKTGILFLPTPSSDEVPAYLSFYGAPGAAGHAALTVVLRHWRDRHGAELVASWGTMLQLAVARPPEDLDAAFALAVEQEAVAGETLWLPGIRIRDHARALLRRPEWFLHARP